MKAKVGMIVSIATFFALLESPRYCCQFKIIGPKSLWLSSHKVNFVEHFENAQAAMSMNTVVGRPGITIPTYPRDNDKIPIVKKTGLCIFKNSFGKNL